MNEVDLIEILDLLRTAYVEENWNQVQEVIDIILKYDSEQKLEAIRASGFSPLKFGL